MSTLTNQEIAQQILGLTPISPFNGYWILADADQRPIVQNRVEISVQRDYSSPDECWRDCPDFMTSLPAAWRIVDHLRMKYHLEFSLSVGDYTDQLWTAEFTQELVDGNILLALASAGLPSEAICLAAESFLFGKDDNLKRLISKLHTIAALPEGWDHYGARALTTDSANLMNALIREVAAALEIYDELKAVLDLTKADLLLMQNGTVVLQFPWNRDTDAGLTFMIDRENKISYSTLTSVMNSEDHQGNIMTENLPEGSTIQTYIIDIIEDYVWARRSN